MDARPFEAWSGSALFVQRSGRAVCWCFGTDMFVLIQYENEHKRYVVRADTVRNFSPMDIEDFDRTKLYEVFWDGDENTRGGYYKAQIHHITGKFFTVCECVSSANEKQRMIPDARIYPQKQKKKCLSGGGSTGELAANATTSQMRGRRYVTTCLSLFSSCSSYEYGT